MGPTRDVRRERERERERRGAIGLSRIVVLVYSNVIGYIGANFYIKIEIIRKTLSP
jgi:hypothetical protein